MSALLPLWTIYYGAADMPAGVFRVRRCMIGPNRITHDWEYSDHPTLEEARVPLIEIGLTNIHRDPSDEPHIVECWI